MSVNRKLLSMKEAKKKKKIGDPEMAQMKDLKDIKQLLGTHSINSKRQGKIRAFWKRHRRRKKDPNQTSRDEKHNAWDAEQDRY